MACTAVVFFLHSICSFNTLITICSSSVAGIEKVTWRGKARAFDNGDGVRYETQSGVLVHQEC